MVRLVDKKTQKESWIPLIDDAGALLYPEPEFLIVDGAPGLDKAIAAVWDGVPVQRCTVHKHRTCSRTRPSACMRRSPQITTT